MSHVHKGAVVLVGSESPADSISWDEAEGFYLVFYSDAAPEDEDDARVMCLGCLVEEGDEQLGRGLDLARKHGLVEWDGAEWRVAEDAALFARENVVQAKR